MRGKFVLLASCLFIQTMFAQTKTISWYQQYDLSNFRTCKEFQSKFNPQAPNYRLLHAAIYFCTNEQRLKYNRKALQYAMPLEVAAYNHSKQMGLQSFFDHKNKKDNLRKNPDDRAKCAGIENPYIAENILFFSEWNVDQFSYLNIAERIILSWKSSPPHWKNILSTESVELGCGVFFIVDEENGGTFYATQNFQFFDPSVFNESRMKDKF
jgi:uncharacterized protein YkwD